MMSPPELMAEAARRLGWLGALYAGFGVVGHIGGRFLEHSTSCKSATRSDCRPIHPSTCTPTMRSTGEDSGSSCSSMSRTCSITPTCAMRTISSTARDVCWRQQSRSCRLCGQVG